MKFYVETVIGSKPYNFSMEVEDIENVMRALALIEVGIQICDGEYMSIDRIAKKPTRKVQYEEIKL